MHREPAAGTASYRIAVSFNSSRPPFGQSLAPETWLEVAAFAKPRRAWLAIIAGLVYVFVFTYSYAEWGLGHNIRPADYRLPSIGIAAAFWWWFVGSLFAFVLVIAFGILDRAARATAWVCDKAREGVSQASYACVSQTCAFTQKPAGASSWRSAPSSYRRASAQR